MKIARRNDLSLRLLEVFGTLMLCRTTTAAAEELGISQPSVSTAIKQLEGQLGFSLFERTKKRLIPTDDARILFTEVEPMFEQLRSVEARVRDLRVGATGKLRIMATPPLGHSVVPEALSVFMEPRPDVTVQYDVRRMENVIDAVAIGGVDIGLCLGLANHPEITVQTLRNDRMVALMRSDHPLAALPIITPSDITAHRFIGLERASSLGLAVQNAFYETHTPYRPQVEVRYCHTAAVLAKACQAVTIVDRYTAGFPPDSELESRPFDPPIGVPACIILRRGRPESRLAGEFQTVLRNTLLC